MKAMRLWGKTSLAMQQLRNLKCHIIVSWKRQSKWYDSRPIDSEIRDAVHDTQIECLQAALIPNTSVCLHITIDIQPRALFAHKAAVFLHFVGAAIHFVAGAEADFGMAVINVMRGDHF